MSNEAKPQKSWLKYHPLGLQVFRYALQYAQDGRKEQDGEEDQSGAEHQTQVHKALLQERP